MLLNETKSILTHATLKVLFDANIANTYLDVYIPFIKYAIKKTHNISNIIVIKDIKQLLKTEFELLIPTHVIEILLRKIPQNEVTSDHGIFYTTSLFNLDTTLEDSISKNKSRLDRFINKFVNSEYNKRTLNHDKSSKLFIDFVNKYYKELLNSIQDYSLLDKSVMNLDEVYLAKYIDNIIKLSVDDYSFFEDVLFGWLMADILINIQDNDIYANNINTLYIYIDTPILLALLDLDNFELFEAMNEMMNIVKKMNIKVRIFRHNIREAIKVINAIQIQLYNVDLKVYNTRFLASINYLRDKKMLKSTLDDLICDIDTRINKLGIEIEDKPSYNDTYYQIDELTLHKDLVKHYKGDIFYTNTSDLELRAQTDVDSISAITRLRKGNWTNRLFESRFIFVTDNYCLVKMAKEIVCTEEYSDQIPPAISDVNLTTILWIQNPINDKVIKSKIASELVSIIQPPANFWRSWSQAVLNAKDLSDDERVFLQYSKVVRELLFDVTNYIPRSVDATTVHLVLEKLRNNHQLEIDKIIEDKNEAIELLRKSHSSELQARDKRLDELDSIVRLMSREKKLNIKYNKHLLMINAIKCIKIVKICIFCIMLICASTLVVSLFCNDILLVIISSILTFFLVIYELIDYFFDVKIIKIIETKLTMLRYRQLCKKKTITIRTSL